MPQGVAVRAACRKTDSPPRWLFPRDGVDERDQHLVTSFSAYRAKRDSTFGAVYQACIDAARVHGHGGTHRAARIPRKLKPGIADRIFCPHTALELIGLLREQLGFNGL
ncbi:hypothetical protein [Candidatus Flexifilum breve]|uniref:hypothetical protein n=1 Tax=Candidatus Flexifilum breve TaxID=3140694 RepID=UPI0031CC5C7B